MRPTSVSYLRNAFIASLCVTALLPCAVFAASLRFSATAGGETREVTLDTVNVQGISYVPLSGLMRQLGGSCQASAARVQVQWAGKTALLGVNNTRVNTSQLEFSLAYPIILREGDAWAAQADLEPLLAQGFQAKTQLSAESAAEEPNVDLDADTAQALAAPDVIPAAEPVITEPSAAAPPVEMPKPAEPPASEPSASEPPAAQAPAAANQPIQAVIIDPGHGGDDAGSAGPGGLVEKDVTLAVAQQLRKIIKEQTAAKALITRDQDRAVSLADRVNRSNQQKAGLFISIHLGVSFSTQAHGFEIFYPPQTGQNIPGGIPKYAGSVASAMETVMGAELRGVHEAPLRGLRGLNMPGLLIEAGVLSNPAEEALLGNEAYQIKIAEGIAQGLKPFLAAAAEQGTTP